MKIHFFSKKKVVHENINDHQIIECPICNSDIKPYWEPRYNGVRATCNVIPKFDHIRFVWILTIINK